MKKFTYKYSQPEEYRFSLDSIEMPLLVARYLQGSPNLPSDLKVLDLCAGCGVIGFELHFHYRKIAQVDFVEVQSVYNSHFELNRDQVQESTKSDTQFKFLNLNYDQLLAEDFFEAYDLVVCNPPYFEVDQGRLSPSDFKNRCRFYMDSDFETLVRVLGHVIRPSGMAYLLLRPLSEHKKDLLSRLRSLLPTGIQMEVVGDVRGTFLVRLLKPA